MADVLVRERPAERRKYTVADLEWLETLPEFADRRFELHEGELKEMPPVDEWHGYLQHEISRHLGNFVEAYGQGRVLVEAGHRTPTDDDTLLAPDVSFRRLDVKGEPPSRRYVSRMPDIAVEVKSPGNSYVAMQRKARLYLKRGTEIVWLVYPERRQVEVCALDEDGEITSEYIDEDGELSGADVLPGFTLPLSRLFS